MRILLALYFFLVGCDREARRYPVVEETPIVDMAHGNKTVDMRYPAGKCGNGDSPDGGIGYCPCCEVRDEKCNIPDREAEWCTSCLEYTYSDGGLGDLYPCIQPVP